MTTLESRISALEKAVQQILALPQLSNLAGRDVKRLIARLNRSLADDKKKLATTTLTKDKRVKLEAQIFQTEFLVSPTLDLTLDDSEARESPNGQAVRVE